MTDRRDLEEAKQALRDALRSRRGGQPRRLARRRNLRLAAHLVRLSAFRRSRLILAYAPVRGEADPAAALATARRAGLTIALPRVTGPHRLAFHLVPEGAPLVPGAFGIPEPGADARTLVDPADAGLILVPGLAFSLTGERLGYGGGFYDALLRQRRAPAVGLGHEWQVLAAVPVARHDVRLDALVTERGTRLFGAAGFPVQSVRSSIKAPPTNSWATASP